MSVSTEDLRAFLVAWRERMADPDRVVLDPDHLYEDADGNEIEFADEDREPPRACMLGHRLLIGESLGYSSFYGTVAYRAETLVLGQGLSLRSALRLTNCTQLLDLGGREGCVEAIDLALAKLTGGER